MVEGQRKSRGPTPHECRFDGGKPRPREADGAASGEGEEKMERRRTRLSGREGEDTEKEGNSPRAVATLK